MRIAAIACLVLGLSRPLISFGSKSSRVHVILLDASLSMRARGRTEAAREQARIVIDGLAAGERAAIIEFATDSRLLAEMTADKSKLNKAIGGYQPARGTTSYAEGLMAAEALLQKEPAGETLIDIVSDFQSSGLRREHSAQLNNGRIQRAKIITHPVGTELGVNAFLVDEEVSAGESGVELNASEIVVSDAERSGTRKRWSMVSREGEHIDAAWHTESNGQVTARIRTVTPDDFDDDDERFLAFDSPRRGRALLIERDGDDAAPYLRAALDATAADFGDNHFSVDVKASLPRLGSELGSYSLISLTLDGSPRAEELRVISDYARAGGTVWLCLSADLKTTEWNQFANGQDAQSFPFATIERKSDPDKTFGFGTADADAPVLRFMSDQLITAMRSINMKKGFSITPRREAATIMRWNDGTVAFASVGVGSGHIIVLATSPARSAGNLGASAAFPALASSIAKLSLAQKEPSSGDVGQPVNLGLTPSAPVKIVDAAGKETAGQARDLITRAAVYFPAPGIFRVEVDGLTRYIAINAPEAESQSALASAADIERTFRTPPAAPQTHANVSNDSVERDRATWRVFLLGGFSLLLAEMWIGMRQRGRNREKKEG